MKEKMLRVPHRHGVMTLPHILLDLVKRNRKEMLNILMRTSAETLLFTSLCDCVYRT